MFNRKPLLTLALLYLAFTIYGSLVPLNYHPYPFEQAWANFTNIRYLNLGIGSRADWVANILLFIPLSFLWLGLFWSQKNLPLKITASLLITLSCIALSLCIEFTQQFFPPRTVSQNDILAESLGTLIGITAWWWKGPKTQQLFRQLLTSHYNIIERLLWIYLAILFGYNILPLDLTISPVELYHKWKGGKIIFIPFTAGTENIAEFTYNIISDIVIWIPVTFLWIISTKKSSLQAWLWTVSAAVILEGMQLMVYSRVTDITDVFTAMVGAAIGCLASQHYKTALPTEQIHSMNINAYLGTIFTIVWCLVLATIFWYPFDFHLDRTILREKISGLYQVPFISYYYGTEFRAITEVIHKVAFFLPLGMALAFIKQNIHHPTIKTYFNIFAILGIIAAAFVIELGQIALPGKHPGNTDLTLEAIGGAIGFYGFSYFSIQINRQRLSQNSNPK